MQRTTPACPGALPLEQGPGVLGADFGQLLCGVTGFPGQGYWPVCVCG